MRVIGLTGGIASGKSTVSAILTDLGVPIIDADQVSREIVEPGEAAYNEIRQVFGEDVIAADGNLDRVMLGQLVFNDQSLRKKLNHITHPRVNERFQEKMKELEGKAEIVVWDVALLFESGMYQHVDEVWLVWVDVETQVCRLMERNGYSREEALARMRSQMPLEEKMKRADRLIDNRGTVEETRSTVTRFYKQLSSILTVSLI